MVLFTTTTSNFDFDVWFVFIINNLFILGVLKTQIKMILYSSPEFFIVFGFKKSAIFIFLLSNFEKKKLTFLVFL